MITEETLRLKHLRKLFQRYPEIRLPFRYKTQESLTVTGIDSKEEDTLIFGADNPVSIIGTIKDTSVYFGIFYLLPADDAIPSLITYDKKGRLIQSTRLAESCYQGCESNCHSIVNVAPNLLITFDYTYYLYECDGGHGASVPYESSGYITTSHITTYGKIELLTRVIKDSAALQRAVILH